MSESRTWQEEQREQDAWRAVFNDMVTDQLPRQFFGVDAECFKLDEQVFKAVEDESDGYRSSMDYVEPSSPEGKIFFKKPVDTVKIEVAPEYDPEAKERPVYGRFRGWVLRSVTDGHVWLLFGTENDDDYYPSFVFRYTPRSK